MPRPSEAEPRQDVDAVIQRCRVQMLRHASACRNGGTEQLHGRRKRTAFPGHWRPG